MSNSGITSLFLIFTTLFFGFKGYSMIKSSPDLTKPLSIAWTMGFLIAVMVIEMFYNIGVAKKICNGSPQNIFTVFLYTFIPNFFILGSVIVLLTMLPGWLSPFSNTFGYFIISCMGLSKHFNAMLKSPTNSGTAGELITKIYSNQSLVINEMTPSNYSDFMKGLSSIFVKNYKSMEQYKHVYSLVIVKNLISEYIWYILAGLLSISIGSHAISNLKCEYSPEEMKKTISKLHDEEEKILEKRNENKPVLYSKTN